MHIGRLPGRHVSLRDLGLALGLAPANAKDTVRRWEKVSTTIASVRTELRAMVGSVHGLMSARSKRIAAARQTYAAPLKGAKRDLLILTPSTAKHGRLAKAARALLSTVNSPTGQMLVLRTLSLFHHSRFQSPMMRTQETIRLSLVTRALSSRPRQQSSARPSSA